MLPIAILAGGYATRLGSIAKGYPKCLIEINGRPFVDWQLDLLIKNGYDNFIFCVSYKSEQIQEYLGNGARYGVQIRYSIDGEKQVGTGGAIRNALYLLGSKFGVIYGDSYLPTDFSKIENYFLDSKKSATMTVYKNQNLFDISNVEYVNGKIISYKKGFDNSNMTHIDYGLSYFNNKPFSEYADMAHFDLSRLCEDLALKDDLDGFEVTERFYEIGSHQGIAQFSEFSLGKDLE